MEKSIKVSMKSNYGSSCFYPQCETSRLLCKIAGKKTITDNMIFILKKDNWNIEIVLDGPKQL